MIEEVRSEKGDVRSEDKEKMVGICDRRFFSFASHFLLLPSHYSERRKK